MPDSSTSTSTSRTNTVTTTESSKNWKVWTIGACVIISSITSCTTTLLTGGNTAEALTGGISGVKQGVEVIQTGEVPATVDKK